MTRTQTSVFTTFAILICGALSGCQEEVSFTRAPIETVDEHNLKSALTNVYVAAPVDHLALDRAISEVLSTTLGKVSTWVKKAGCKKDKRGRLRCGNVRVTGELRRSGATTFKAQGNTFELYIPISYVLEMSGVGRASHIADSVLGRMNARLDYSISLDKNSQPVVSSTREVAFDGPTEIQVGEKTLDLKRQLTRGLTKNNNKIANILSQAMDPEPAKTLLSVAWRNLHYPFRTGSGVEVWLRGEPKAVYFAGLLGEGADLSVRYGIRTPLRTYVGERPLPLIPVGLPEILPEPPQGTTIGSGITMQTTLGYDDIQKRLLGALPVGTEFGSAPDTRPMTIKVTGLRLFPAGGRLALETGLNAQGDEDWAALVGDAYMVGLPRVSANGESIELGFAEFTAPMSRPDLFVKGKFVIPADPIRNAFSEALHIRSDEVFSDLLENAANDFSMPFGESLRLKSRFKRLALENTAPGKTGLDVAVSLRGELTLVRDLGGQANNLLSSAAAGAEAPTNQN